MKEALNVFSSATFWLGVILTIALITAAHYVWGRSGVNRWELMGRYACGVAAFAVPFVAWCIECRQFAALAAFAAFVTAAGIWTRALLVDEWDESARDREQIVKEVMGDG